MQSPAQLLDWNAENIPMFNNFAILNSCLLKNQQDTTKKYHFNDDKEISDSIDYDVPMLNNLAILYAESHENRHDVENKTELKEVEISNNTNYDYYIVNNDANSHAHKEDRTYHKIEKVSNEKFIDYNIIMMCDKNGVKVELLDMKNNNKTELNICCDQDDNKLVTETVNEISTKRTKIKGTKEGKVKRHLRGGNNVKNVFSHKLKYLKQNENVKTKTGLAHIEVIKQKKKETNHPNATCEIDIKSQAINIVKTGSTVLLSKISETESIIINPNKISKTNEKSQDPNIIVGCQKQNKIEKTECISHANETELKRKLQNNVEMKTNTNQSEICQTVSEQTHNIPDYSSNCNGVENKDLLGKRTQFSCCICNFKTFTRNIWNTHIHEHVRYRYLKKIFACHYCRYIARNHTNIIRHLTTHTNDEPYSCKTWLTMLHGLIDYKYVQSLFACDYCQFITLNKTDITRHIMTHTGDKPYSCHLCKYKSMGKQLLKTHLRTHTGEKPYACNICDFKSASDQGVKKHKRVHTGDKRYICKHCDRGFIQSGSLVKHIRTHTGERPYVCSVCDHKFMQKIALQIHMRTHTGEKPYSCDLCEYKSRTKSTLSRHRKKHTRRKLTCKRCNYKCARSTTLVNHMKVHRKKKSITCSLCKHVCTKKDLKLHMKSHEDIKHVTT